MVKIRRLIRFFFISVRYFFYTKLYKMDIAKSARVSFGAKLDKTNPKGIHIGEETYISSGVYVLSHDFIIGEHVDTSIGKRCFIGLNVIIMPGVTIGDEVFVAAGSIVSKNIKSNSLVSGNPAKVIRKDIQTGKYGKPL